MWLEKEWRTGLNGIRNYDFKQRLAVIKVDFRSRNKGWGKKWGWGIWKWGQKQAGNHCYKRHWRPQKGWKGKDGIERWCREGQSRTQWLVCPRHGRRSQRLEGKLDKKNCNTPNSCKAFRNLQSVFNMLTDSGCGVHLSWAELAVTTRQAWEKSAAADLWKLGSGIGKSGLFCTKVAAEIKGLHLQGRDFKDSWY